MSKLFGKAVIKADGDTFDNLKGATFDPGGLTRTTQTGSNKVLGFTEEPAPSKLEFDFALRAGTSIDAYRRMDNATISFTADTGQAYIVNGAWCTTPPVLTEGEGKVKITFEGPPAEEVL